MLLPACANGRRAGGASWRPAPNLAAPRGLGLLEGGVAAMWGALKNLGGSNNPKHVRAMAEAEAKCAAMGIKANHSSELGLAELAMM